MQMIFIFIFSFVFLSMKILVCYINNDNIDQLFTRISKINKSNSFDFLLCFGLYKILNNNSKYLNKKDSLPIDTYLIGCTLSDNIYPKNLYILPSYGISKIGELSIVYYIEETDYMNLQLKHENENDENYLKLISQCTEKQSSYDILLTNYWPQNILNQVNIDNYPLDLKESNNSYIGSRKVKCLNELCTPRYHFSSCMRSGFEIITEQSQIYYERQPFKHQTVNHICRFISLANIGTKNQKWLYAGNIQSLSNMSKEQINTVPINCTESPFIDKEQPIQKKQKHSHVNSAYNAFLPEENIIQNTTKQYNNNKKKKHTMGSCWFCIDGDKVEDHLITSIGDECYLALPKGGLVSDHILIIPIDHITNPFEMTKETKKEIQQYKEKLQEYAESKNNNMIFYERNVETQFGMVHYMIQCIPIPKTLSIDNIKSKFEDIGKTKYNITFQIINQNQDLSQLMSKNSQYFIVDLPNNTKLLHIVNNTKHPLQFGREVIAELLNLQNRINWKKCILQKSKEIQLANNFKENFKSFEINSI